MILEVCIEQMVNVCSQHACQCYTAFASASNACIISSYSTPQRLRILLTLPSLFYSISWQEGQPQISKICICSVKYQVRSTLGSGDFFFFVTHKEFICHIFREWGKIPGTSIYYKDFWLIFFKSSLLCWRTSCCIFVQLNNFTTLDPIEGYIKWLSISFSGLSNISNFETCKLHHYIFIYIFVYLYIYTVTHTYYMYMCVCVCILSSFCTFKKNSITFYLCKWHL